MRDDGGGRPQPQFAGVKGVLAGTHRVLPLAVFTTLRPAGHGY
jgi:hypothetical protein